MKAGPTQTDIADNVVRGLTSFATEVVHDQVGDVALRAAKRCLVDAVGCALGAQETDVISALRAVASTATSSRPATLWGTTIQTTPDMAAFVNGSATRCLDFNDDYFGTEKTNAHGDTGPHPSDNLGGILSAAEVAGASGSETLLGIVIAYEVCGQLVDEVVLRGNGWDHPLFHSIATSAAAARLLGLSRAQTANAIRLAVVPNICLYETRVGSISNWKGLAGPNGSRNGLFAAVLAEAGITGPEMAFEGARGFMRQLDHEFSLGQFGSPQRPFRVENTYFKHLPLRYEMQLPVQLALEMRKTVDPRDIATMRVYMERKSVVSREAEPALWRPSNRETADHSGPYLIAAALVDGAITEATFEAERYLDPSLLDVTNTIQLIEDPAYTASFPWQMACRFEVALKDGRALTLLGENPKGHPRNPMTDDEISAKFLGQVEPRLGEDRAEELLQCIWSLEEQPSLERLFTLMVPDSTSTTSG
ncbi:MmgE/PrpD family protein [Streptomyces europaeiscabiei]|uniref:MmgE/PrpD family protein n=1 Tax=Streptomyces europaeiscabiei TaxID=146819 RepID=UPI002E17AC02|nr:MmgE/PrpD family protein [Streptomyces europaeiscabiei]